MRLQEIEARLAEIRGEIENRGADLTTEQIAALETEVAELKAKKAELLAAADQRSSLLSSIAEGQTETTASRAFPSPAAASENAEQRSTDFEDPLSTIEYRRAFMNHVLRGEAIPAEYRADALTMTTDIGAAIPTTIINTVVERMEAVGMILDAVTRTAYKGGVQVPTSSVKPVASWVAEGTGSDKQKKPLGNVTFAYYKLRCAVAVSLEVDTVAISAFESTLANNIVEAMTKALEQAIVSGTGTGQPKGILAETPADGQVISSTEPSYADIVAAEAALPEEYEAGAVWCMSKKTFMSYIGLTDETGQPIARVNYGIAGKPERVLLGRPVMVCKYVKSFTAELADGEVFAFLFDFKDYAVNTNYALGIKKYEDNETDDLVTKAVMLVDGKVIDKGSLVTIAKATA